MKKQKTIFQFVLMVVVFLMQAVADQDQSFEHLLSDPSLLLKNLEAGQVTDSGKLQMAIACLAENKTVESLSYLKKIRDGHSDADVRYAANVAIQAIEGQSTEIFLKRTPLESATSYVKYFQEHLDWYGADELEFWMNPQYPEAKSRWNDYILKEKNTAKGQKEQKDRERIAEGLQTALNNPDAFQLVKDNKCNVIVAGRIVATFYKDLLGQWRFAEGL